MNQLNLYLLFFVMLGCDTYNGLDIQGHRGFRGLWPENSLIGFEKAIEIGVHTLELDVVISKDNVVVVSHEPNMNPEICLMPNGNVMTQTEGKSINLYRLNYNEISQYDCGSKGHPYFKAQEKIKAIKPTLEAVFKYTQALNPDIKYNIELKSTVEGYGVNTPYPERFTELVLKVIKDYKLELQTCLQSFDINILEAIKKQAPTMDVALLVDENESINHKIATLSFAPEVISPYYKLLNNDVTKKLQSQGFKVIPWTVNDKTTMQTLISYGVDGIITDYPDILINLLKSKY